MADPIDELSRRLRDLDDEQGPPLPEDVRQRERERLGPPDYGRVDPRVARRLELATKARAGTLDPNGLTPAERAEAARILRERGADPYVASDPEYNIIDRISSRIADPNVRARPEIRQPIDVLGDDTTIADLEAASLANARLRMDYPELYGEDAGEGRKSLSGGDAQGGASAPRQEQIIDLRDPNVRASLPPQQLAYLEQQLAAYRETSATAAAEDPLAAAARAQQEQRREAARRALRYASQRRGR